MILNHVDIRAKLAVIQRDLESTSPFLASVDRVRKPFRQCGSRSLSIQEPKRRSAAITAYPCSHIRTGIPICTFLTKGKSRTRAREPVALELLCKSSENEDLPHGEQLPFWENPAPTGTVDSPTSNFCGLP